MVTEINQNPVRSTILPPAGCVPAVSRRAACFVFLALLAGCGQYRVTPGTTDTPTPAGSLAIAPQSPCLALGAAQQFTATLTNVSGTGVNWSVDSIPGGNSTVGVITSGGLYTAPSASGQHTVGVASQADANASASTAVNVTSSPGLAILPDSATLAVSEQQAFAGQSCGAPAAHVKWAVDNIEGGNSSVGTISTDGVYTAPAAEGTHTIQATDTAHNASSIAAVTVTSSTAASAIVADFGSRGNKTYPIPAGILGANHVDWWFAQAQQVTVAQAGFKLSRTYAKVSEIYPTRQPNWSAIDPQMTKLQASGFHVLMQLAFSPPWLQGNTTSCGSDPTKAAPSDPGAWAELARSIVAHMDQKFPGIVTDYEIWNEPDSGGLCGTTDKLGTYLALYAAAAPKIKQQASTDGFTIRVGGPAASVMDPAWFQAMLSNGSTAPYVQFISYHQYFTGKNNINADWNTVYSLTQDPTAGAAATFAAAARIVASGKQPQAASTPIYVDEFNTNWVFQKDCCRSDPTYAPVWNGLYVTDMLNTVYSGTTHLPGQLTYYAAVSLPYFCVLGDWNANMDCSHASGNPVPYPQYYAYELMASTNYLGMNDSGYMAGSVSIPAAASGVVATAFYTNKQDSILITNPTSSSYSQVVRIANPGFSAPSAVLFQVENGRTISKSGLKLTKSGTAYTAPLTIPAHSVIGIAIQ